MAACQSTPGGQGADCPEPANLHLELAKTINIPVDTLQYKHLVTGVYSNDSTLLYFGLDAGRNALDVFDLLQEKYLRTIYFSLPYTRKPIKVDDFYVLSPDSIFVFSSYSYKLQIISINGQLIDDVRIVDDKLEKLHNGQIIGLEPLPARMVYDRYNKAIWLPATPGKLEGDPDFFEQPFLLAFSLESHHTLTLCGAYPFHYDNDRQTPFTQSAWFTIVEVRSLDELMLQFYGSPYLLRYNWHQQKVMASYCIKSRFVDFPFPVFKGDLRSYKERRQYRLVNGLYLAISGITGPYRYFPVRHAQELLAPDGLQNDFYTPGWSVIVTDTAWNVLGEMEFPGNKYDIYNLHNTAQGLLVSKENPNNRDNDEDILEFEVYRYRN